MRTRLEAELSSTSGTQSQPRHRNVNPTSTRDASTENHLSDDDFWQVSPTFRLPAGFLSLGIPVGSHLHAEQLPKVMKNIIGNTLNFPMLRFRANLANVLRDSLISDVFRLFRAKRLVVCLSLGRSFPVAGHS